MAKKKKLEKRISVKRKKYKAFFAYPSGDSTQSDIIEKAITLINQNSDFNIQSWRNLKGPSSRIISNILEEISKSDLLIADITELNSNVLFEVGYAFGKQKNIMLFTQGNSSQNRSKDLQDLEMLSSLAIESFQNCDELRDLILKKNPFDGAPIPDILRFGIQLDQQAYNSTGLFLKGATRNELGLAALTSFKACFTQTRVDDWMEDGSQPLTWYLQSVLQSNGICALFINSSWDRSREVNARFSFICGMACALEKQVLMIGLPGFVMPFDYKEILKRPQNADMAKQVVIDAFQQEEPRDQKNTIQRLLPDTSLSLQKTLSSDDKELILIDVHIGNTIAENEEAELADYFVETGQFRAAISTKQAIVVGSKGTGKTATFYQIRDQLADKTVLVCDIKPAGYKIARFIDALKKLYNPQMAAAHVAESAWKMIIYSHLLIALKNEIMALPIQVNIRPEQQKLLEFTTEYKFIVDVPFEQQLDIASEWLAEEKYDTDNFTRRIHDKFLSQAKSILSPVLVRKSRTIILLDNLDKEWMVHSDLNIQSQMVFSILGLHKKVETDLGLNINLSVIVFLRRNIFEFILKQAREPDKLIADSIELSWDDQTMLLRVIEERFKSAAERNSVKSIDPWQTFFTDTVDGVDTKQWIFQNTLPRPRDLIHFLRRSIENAISRGHSKILEDDLKSALTNHSAFALNQIVAEYQAEEEWLPTVLHSFFGKTNGYTYKNLYHHLEKLKESVAISVDKDTRDIIATLVSVRFMGLKLTTIDIRYASTIQEGITLTDKVKNHPISEPLELIIHPVFIEHLGLRDIMPTVNDMSITEYQSISRMLVKVFKKIFGT